VFYVPELSSSQVHAVELPSTPVDKGFAAANEYWTILASDKKTVVVQPFKITQDNQWLSIAGSNK